jgi:hypothetical protein
MEQELAALLPLWKPALLLMCPSLVVGLLVLIGAYKLASKLGDRFLDSQERQALSFEKIATGVERMKTDIEYNTRLNDDIRITLAALAVKINQIYDEVHNREYNRE